VTQGLPTANDGVPSSPGRYAVIGCKLKQNANEGCNSCASLAGLVSCFIACFISVVIAPLFSWSEIIPTGLPSSNETLVYTCLLLARSHVIKHNRRQFVGRRLDHSGRLGDLSSPLTSCNIGRDFGDIQGHCLSRQWNGRPVRFPGDLAWWWSVTLWDGGVDCAVVERRGFSN